MIVRKIKPEEYKRTEEMFSIAFGFPYDCEKEPLERYQEKMQKPEAREDEQLLSKYAAFEDDDKTMMSCFTVTRFPINFNGSEVTLAGIGGVSTSPVYRKRGGIRACFTKMLPEIYKEGVVFSYLYPFSTAFYNKFGYGYGIRGKAYDLSLSGLPRFEVEGSCVLAEPQNCKELVGEFMQVYEIWQQKYNGMVINGDMEYQFVTKANPCKEQEFVYLYRSQDGTPKGYMAVHKEIENGVAILAGKKFVFRDEEGLRGLLQLAAGYASNYKSIRFTVPEDIEVEAVLRELCFDGCAVHTDYMGLVRAVNVAEILKLSSYQGSGEISLKVTDPYIEENNGVFHVIYKDGKAVAVERRGGSAGDEDKHLKKEAADGVIRMHIDKFSEFIFQNRSANNFLYYGEEALSGEEVCKLEKTFVRKTSFLMEYF